MQCLTLTNVSCYYYHPELARQPPWRNRTCGLEWQCGTEVKALPSLGGRRMRLLFLAYHWLDV